MRPRWRKVLRELRRDPAKNLMLVLAIAVGVFGVGTILGAYAVLTRTMRASYLGSVPASATVAVEGALDPATVAAIAGSPGIARAERHATLTGRMKVDGAWMPLLIFVIDDFTRLETNRITSLAGAWPPPPGTMLVERTALPVMRAAPGERVLVRGPHGAPRELTISGVVHDPGLAPAWQEKEGYAYVTPATLGLLGERGGLDELRVLVEDPAASREAIEARATAVATELTRRGLPVHEVQVPPPRAHPHQGQMNAVLTLFIVFSFLTLGLAAVVVASSIAATMAKQVREIGVMKTLGARSGQIAGLYLGLVAGLAALALAIGVPLSRLAASAMIDRIAVLLNLEVGDRSIPPSVLLLQLGAGLLIPLVVTAVPVWRGSRIGVRQALDDFGVAAGFGGRRIDRALARLRVLGDTFTLSLRNAFRQRGRLLLTLGLLAAGGAVFLAALNLARMWEVRLGAVTQFRRDDIELRLAEPLADPEPVLRRIRALPGVLAAEAWIATPIAFTRGGEAPIVRTYPDKAHASFTLLAFPPSTTLLTPYPLRGGRWVEGPDEVVLNQLARAQAPGLVVGDAVHLTIDGRHTTWRVAGFVEDIGRPATAYALTTGFGPGRDAIRVAYADRDDPRLTAPIEDLLEAGGVRIEGTTPILELRSAIGDHMRVLVSSLLALAVLMALVGSLGLASTMSVTVLERTRELGVLRAIGATPSRIAGLVIGEGLITGLLSLTVAFLLSLPLSAGVGWLIGRMAFGVPLAVAVSVPALLGWIAIVGVGAIAATLVPALRAARLTTREALAYE